MYFIKDVECQVSDTHWESRCSTKWQQIVCWRLKKNNRIISRYELTCKYIYVGRRNGEVSSTTLWTHISGTLAVGLVVADVRMSRWRKAWSGTSHGWRQAHQRIKHSLKSCSIPVSWEPHITMWTSGAYHYYHLHMFTIMLTRHVSVQMTVWGTVTWYGLH